MGSYITAFIEHMITKDLLLKIARLARLHVSEVEVPELSGNLNSIFDYMDQLGKADVRDVQPMSHVLAQTNVFRPDVAEPSLPIEDMLRNAPDSNGRFIRVPIIVEPGSES